MSWVDEYVSWCFFIGMAAPVLFVLVYALGKQTRRQWYKTWEGRVIMLGEVFWIAVLLNGVLYWALGPDWHGRNVFRVLLFTALPIKLWAMTVLLVVRRRQGASKS